MKKIMFNDKYHLTDAVLEGRKTMARRIIPEKYHEYLNAWENPVIVVPLESIPDGMTIEEFAKAWSEHTGRMKIIPVKKEPKVELFDARLELFKNIASFMVGDVVAVAQCYKDIREKYGFTSPIEYINRDYYEKSAGWINKMFVRPSCMPHRIRITNVRVERLQDISDEECLKEGIIEAVHSCEFCGIIKDYTYEGAPGIYAMAREAFSALINRVCGKGTWDRNPWVFVYEFELVK